MQILPRLAAKQGEKRCAERLRGNVNDAKLVQKAASNLYKLDGVCRNRLMFRPSRAEHGPMVVELALIKLQGEDMVEFFGIFAREYPLVS